MNDPDTRPNAEFFEEDEPDPGDPSRSKPDDINPPGNDAGVDGPDEATGRAATPTATGRARRGREHADAFFERDGRDVPSHANVLRRIAWRPRRLAGVFLALGFVGVFVVQANILHQIILGAPIFEEFLKGGLGLLLVLALRIRAAPLALLVGALPGAAFGWLEHITTYPDEAQLQYLWRMLFHSGASGLTAVTFLMLAPLRDVRVRWGSTIPASLFHYLNNFLAVVLGVGTAVSGVGEDGATVGLLVGGTITALTWGTALLITVAPGVWRRWVRRLFPDPPPARFRPTGP